MKNMSEAILFKTSYCMISYNAIASTLFVRWDKKSQQMPERTFRKIMMEVGLRVEKYVPNKILFNAKEFSFMISSENQDWHRQHIMTKYTKAGVQKIAFVASEYILSQLSIEQMFDEKQAFEVGYFEDSKDAAYYLLDKQTIQQPV